MMRAYSFSTSSYFAGNGAARPLCTHAVLETKVAMLFLTQEARSDE